MVKLVIIKMIKSALKEEERIVEKIQKFLCLYRKGNKGYKENDEIEWREF